MASKELEKRIRLLELELRVKERDLLDRIGAVKAAQAPKQPDRFSWFSGANVPILTAIIGGAISLIVVFLQKRADTRLERQKFTQSIIEKVISKEGADQAAIQRDLLFYSKLGIIDISNITRDTAINGRDTSIFTTPVPGFSFRGVSGRQEQALRSSLLRFRDYLAAHGYEPVQQDVFVNVAVAGVQGAYCYYLKDTIFIDAPFADDPDLANREYIHHNFLGQGSADTDLDAAPWYVTIESGLAYYLPCSIRNDPQFGAASLRKDTVFHRLNLQRQPLIKQLRPEDNDQLYYLGCRWAAAFWELRTRLGPDYTDRLLCTGWHSLPASVIRKDNPVDFIRALTGLDRVLSGGVHGAEITGVFERHGVKMGEG